MNGTDYIMLIPVMIIIPIFTVLLMQTNGFDIERPYLEEYRACQAELEDATRAQCAPCECNEGVTGIVWSIIGFLALAGGYFWFWDRTKKADKIIADAEAKADKILKDAQRRAKK